MIGESGVAAYSVMMYVDFVFVASVSLGFSAGSAPIVSYQYGAGNHQELHNIFRKSLTVIGITSVAMVAVSEGVSHPLSVAFVRSMGQLLDMTVGGFRIFALGYLFCGINIYASSFFTALCNGMVSALLFFTRSFLLRGGLVILMPLLFGLNGTCCQGRGCSCRRAGSCDGCGFSFEIQETV